MATAKKLPSGAWRVQIYAGKNSDGKRQYKSFTAANKRKAEMEALTWQEHYQEINSSSENMTVGEAIDKYIDKREGVISPSTISGYKRQRKNCLQGLVLIKLNKLTSESVQSEVKVMAKTHSPKYVLNAYNLFLAAVRENYPNINLSVVLPQVMPNLSIPAEDYTEEIIKASIGSNVELPVMLAAWLGLRMSEIRGLKWSSLNDGILYIDTAIVDCDGKPVEKCTKSKSGTRKVRVPEYILMLIDQQPKENKYIVKESGQAIYKRFSRLCQKSGIPHFRFHDLRHLNASQMLLLGVPDKYAMERGGWATKSTLKKVYQHTFDTQREKVDDLIDAHFSKFVQHEMQHSEDKT